jgi:hypothetical protein
MIMIPQSSFASLTEHLKFLVSSSMGRGGSLLPPATWETTKTAQESWRGHAQPYGERMPREADQEITPVFRCHRGGHSLRNLRGRLRPHVVELVTRDPHLHEGSRGVFSNRVAARRPSRT